MADPIVFGLVDGTGAAAAGAVPIWVGDAIFDREGNDRTAPEFFNRGDGQHGFEPTDPDEVAGCVGLIDAGAGFYFENGGRYAAVTIPEAAHFEAFVLTDGLGGLWVGDPPTFQSYEGRTSPIAPLPVILAIGALFTFTPRAADVADGVSYRINAPGGAYPSKLFGSPSFIRTPGVSSTPRAGLSVRSTDGRVRLR